MIKFVMCLLLVSGAAHWVSAQPEPYRLIAHRGGIVNDTLEENSIPSLVAAAKRHYYMVELDVRMTNDSVLVAHHDRDLKRYYDNEKQITDLSWNALSSFVSAQGNRIQKLETLLDTCMHYGMQVMIDWKIQGHNQQLCEALVAMLDKRSLRDSALIIPSAETTDFFRGKIRLSCNREQLELYQQRNDYHPSHYYLFANPSPEDFRWAKARGILVVGVLNAWTNKSRAHYAELAKHLRSLGVRYIQLDSEFDGYFGI